MKSKLFLTLLTSLCLSVSYAQSVVINKIYNSGVTSPAGQGDVIELLVIQDYLDMRNMIVKDFYGGNATATTLADGAAIKFKNTPFWSSMRAGTLIVLRRWPVGYTAYVQDEDPSDKVLDLRIGDTDYLSYESMNDSFNITNYDMVMIKTGTITGIENAIHTFAFGINSSNVTYNAVTGPKMYTYRISPTGNNEFLYTKNNTISLADYNALEGINSSSETQISLTWGAGSGANNIAFINSLRNLDHLYVHKNGNEEIGGIKTFTGNVSIGTSDSKGYKLAVAGNMIAEEIKVKLQGNWPDYVFAKGYQLPSLAEVEQFIKTNKHLPGVPSEKEVKATGDISLGEMNRILLKKVEELTLYLIQQQKTIDSLLKDKK